MSPDDPSGSSKKLCAKPMAAAIQFQTQRDSNEFCCKLSPMHDFDARPATPAPACRRRGGGSEIGRVGMRERRHSVAEEEIVVGLAKVLDQRSLVDAPP